MTKTMLKIGQRLYTIGTKKNVCHGHGDYQEETKIEKTGIYGTGEYPPIFTKETEAKKYLKGMKFNYDKVVVSFILRG